MTRRVDQIENIVLAIRRLIVQPNGLRLDGDAPLFFDIHRVEHLLGHLSLRQPPCHLDQAVSERRFPVVNMCDNREIADVFGLGHRRGYEGAFMGGQALETRDLSRFRITLKQVHQVSSNPEPETCFREDVKPF